jgi:hypothetical protein
MAVDNKVIEFLSRHLFSEEGMNVYAVLDGASVPNLRLKLYDIEPEHECLYRGELDPDMAEVAPYLIKLGLGEEFTRWVMGEGWGKHWGIFVASMADLRTLRTHFRRFLMVHDNDGKPMYFRYYDPRVLRVYLPTCNAEELKTVFGPVRMYLVEDEGQKSGRKFVYTGNSMREDRFTLEGG